MIPVPPKASLLQAQAGLDDVAYITSKKLAQARAGGATPPTSAQLLALSAAASAQLSFTYCSDCLTPYGTGAFTYWDGSTWRAMNTRIAVTTDPLTYYRSYSTDFGQTTCSTAGAGACENGAFSNFPVGTSWATQNSGAANNGQTPATTGRPFWEQLQLATAANAGVRQGGNQPFSATLLSSFYMRTRVSLSALSTVAEEFNVRMGFQAPVAYTLQSEEAGIFYDRGNTLGSLNAGNSDVWICVSRHGSTNQLTVTAVAPSIVATAPDLLEMLFTASTVTFYINGTLAGTHSTQVPSGTLCRNIIANKSAGTTTRNVLVGDIATLYRFA